MTKAVRRLSQMDLAIFRFVADYIEQNSIPPSIRDIEVGLNISSTSVVRYRLNHLVKTGYIGKQPKIARGLKVLAWPRELRQPA